MSLSPAESRATPAGRRRFAPSALTTSLTQQQLIHSPAVIRQSLRPWLATMAPDVYTDSTQDHMRREIAHKWHWQLRSHHTHIQAYSTRKHRSHQRPQQSPITHMPRDVRCTVAHAYGTQARFRGLFGGLGGRGCGCGDRAVRIILISKTPAWAPRCRCRHRARGVYMSVTQYCFGPIRHFGEGRGAPLALAIAKLPPCVGTSVHSSAIAWRLEQVN